jgi:phosphoribosyl 1,2-cyclic phosphate phosphodiesterase
VIRRFTILGCASSPGVPRVDGSWGACNPNNPKNRRTRAALLVEQIGKDGGITSVVIDTGPDFRQQMITAGVKHIDAVLYTHPHADHVHGIDDVRGYFHAQHRPIPIYADEFTMDRIEQGFGYCLKTPPGSGYPPIAEPHIIESPDSPVTIDGAGGKVTFMPVLQEHGSIHSLGFRVGNFAYCCDVSNFPERSFAKLKGLDLLVLDCLQYKYHPSHLSLVQALGWIERFAPKRTILTHMHVPLDYDKVMDETPDHVEPGFDGMRLELEVRAKEGR